MNEYPDDRELMARVAERRDREAFAHLVARHEDAAFNLACFLAGNRAGGEEAVQEAMLLAWKNAGRFEYRGAGSVRSWLLRLVANEGIRLRRRQVQSERRACLASVHTDRSLVSVPDETVEEDELRNALRVHVDALGSLDRNLVGLYFGAGLDQASIAKALSISQQAVSHRLKRVLGTLRRELQQNGFSAALPLLETTDLGGVLHTGLETPSELSGRIVELCSQAGRVAAPLSSVALVWGGGALLLAAGGFAWWWMGSFAPAPGPGAAMGGPDSVARQSATRKESFDSNGWKTSPSKFHHRWDFRRQAAGREFEVLAGEWIWRAPGSGRSGGMEVQALGESALVRLPARPPKHPLRLRVISTPLTSQHAQKTGAGWLDGRTRVGGLHKRRTDMRMIADKGSVWEFLLSGPLIVSFRDGVFFSSWQGRAPFPGEEVLLNLANHRVEEIEFEEVLPEVLQESMDSHPRPFESGPFEFLEGVNHTYPGPGCSTPAAGYGTTCFK